MVILERIKGEPSGNKIFKDFVYRIGLAKHNGLTLFIEQIACPVYRAVADLFKLNEDYLLLNH